MCEGSPGTHVAEVRGGPAPILVHLQLEAALHAGKGPGPEAGQRCTLWPWWSGQHPLHGVRVGVRVIHLRPPGPCLAFSELSVEQL